MNTLQYIYFTNLHAVHHKTSREIKKKSSVDGSQILSFRIYNIYVASTNAVCS